MVHFVSKPSTKLSNIKILMLSEETLKLKLCIRSGLLIKLPSCGIGN